MRIAAFVLALVLLVVVLRDAFETIILPRRVRRRFQLTRIFYRTTWRLWRGIATRLGGAVAEPALGWFGPFSLLMLLVLWAVSIVTGFGLLQWAGGPGLELNDHPIGLLSALYYSGTTFFTLGLGDISPLTPFARVLTVVEAGLGFAFLAIVVGYLPVIYQAFSRRETTISLLDARAGSPPTAGELLVRHGPDPEHRELERLLMDWERWAAELLESHLSYPVLAYFRSQHGNQSWLAALTVVLDTSALAIVGSDDRSERQAQLTFAMARHAVVDLAQVFGTRNPARVPERLSHSTFVALRDRGTAAGLRMTSPDAESKLASLRSLYEPYLTALSRLLELPLPPWIREGERLDNWETAPWAPRPVGGVTAEHFMER